MRWVPLLGLAVLLAACVEPEGPEGDGTPSASSSASSAPPISHGNPPGFAVQQGHAHGSNHSIDMDVSWRACEAGFCANATARNNGTQAVQVSAICVPPWQERMARDGQPVQHQEPRAYCAAYGVKDFAPGEQAQADLTWDQRLWDDGQASPAPEGSYTWTIVFWWEDAQHQRQEASADVHLVVGET